MNMRWVFLVIIIILIQIKITAMIIYVDILMMKITSDEMASLMSSSYKGYSGILKQVNSENLSKFICFGRRRLLFKFGRLRILCY